MTVQVAVRALLRGKYADSGIAAQLFKHDQLKGVVYVGSMNLPMIDHKAGEARQIEELSNLEPGSYFLEIALPNGKVMTQPFELGADRKAHLIIDVPHEGPHEWTSLQALTGQLRRRGKKLKERVASRGGMGAVLRSAVSRSALGGGISEDEFRLFLISDAEGAGGSILAKGGNVFDFLNRLPVGAPQPGSVLDRLGRGRPVPSPTREDDEYAVYRFGHQGLLAEGEEEREFTVFTPGASLDRTYLLLQKRQSETLICLPTPWATPEGTAAVELLIDKDVEGDDAPFTITIDEPLANTVLGYLNAGMVHKALELVNYSHAEKMLNEKTACPLAAAVGGYLLLLGLDRKRYREASGRWKSWVENLDLWFDWLPDGAILHAALHFMFGDCDEAEARDALMRAYGRGLPFFTFGLKLLTDGMRFFANQGDDEAKQALQVVQAVANRADPSHAFLTITLSE